MPTPFEVIQGHLFGTSRKPIIIRLPIVNKKLIRRWDSERELSLRRHRTRTTKKIRQRSTRRLCVGTYMFTKFSEITQCNGHYAVQGHSRSPILVPIESSYTTSYWWLLLTSPILHRFQVTADYSIKFSLARGECLTLTLSLAEIPCQYRRKWYIVKNYILWPTFLPQKVSVYLQPLLRNPPRNLPNSVKLSSR